MPAEGFPVQIIFILYLAVNKYCMEKFNVVKQNPILFCIVDNLDLCLSGWAREININLTDFLIHRCIIKGYDVYIGKDQNALLKLAQEDNYY